MQIRRASWLRFAISAVAALAFQMPVHAFIYDTYGDGFWTVINQGNNNTLVVNNIGASQAVGTNTAFQQQFELLYNVEDGTFRLRNHDSWLCIGARNGATTNGTPVVTVSSYTGATSQRWNFVSVGSGNYQIVNVASGLALQTDNGAPAKVTLAPVAANNFQYWHFAYQTHYPKKGLAGWDDQWPRFNINWGYNWGWGYGFALPAQTVYEPMQWGDWNVDMSAYAAWHATEKPMYVMGFNEPDGSGQANMTTDAAIARWPQLQAMNLPLVSPAPVNPFNGWLGDFYNKIAANGYRVDFTAVHWYGNPDATSLLNTLDSVYGTWGRAAWLTEFSTVDWGGTATWSEHDNYRFLAEFLWQVEDHIGIKRYSLFSFGGTPSVNPWDGNGHRGDDFLADGYTFTPYGELYAAWDADRTQRPMTPYYIHNAATCFRMASTRNLNGPAASSIRFGDAATQWVFTNAPTAGRYYIQSLNDGRRLRFSASVLDLAPPATTGAPVEWTFNGPDSKGYYFIDNPNSSVSLNCSGSFPGIGFSTLPFGSPSDNTRFRFVKPYFPASLAAVAVPTALSATPADRSVTLRWTGSAPRYQVYRSTTSGSGYTKINADIKRNFYTDNAAVNGNTYYYIVRSLDSLENESPNSTQASAAPASGLNLGLVAEYKFENGAQDSSGNGFHGTVNGTTSVVAGKVDSSAINFTGGDNSFVEIPNPLGNDFSISFWLNTTAAGGTGQWWAGKGLVDGEVAGATNDFGVSLLGGNVGFGIGNSDVTITSSTAVNDGQWHHITATRNSTSGALQLFVDGVLRAAGTGATGTRATPVSLRLASLQTGFNYLAGSIDEVRLYNYALNAAEAKALATPASTLVANYGFEGNASDTSGFANSAVAKNNVTFVAGKVGAQAAQFDGATSYLQIPASVANDFSIACWVKTTAAGGAGQWWNGLGLVDGEIPGAMADFGLSLIGNKAAFGVGNPDTTITSTSAINDGQWHHVAATRNNASGAMKLYVDGVLQALANGPAGTRGAPTGLRIGSLQPGGGFFSGTMDDVRLYNYQLGASQIAALFAPQPLPAPWTDTDIGSPGSPGYANYASATGIWALGGSGGDIWLGADQFHFAYSNFTGAGSVAARLLTGAVLSDGTTNANAKAGIMFRSSLATNSPLVALVHDQGQGLQFLYRDSTGAVAGQQGANVAVNPAVWLRLVRSNNTFTAWYATTPGPPTPDFWILIGSHTTTLANAAVVGVVDCSHDNARLANTTFTGVSVAPPAPPNISAVPDQVIAENTATPVLEVMLGDALVTGNNLVLTASSSNTNLVPNANILLGGSGFSRTVQVTPATYQSGSATITLIVNNGQPTANTATNSFLVTVQTSAAGGWRQQFFGTTANIGNAADNADPDGDGIANVMERFFGSNPLVAEPSSGVSAAAMLGGNLTMNYAHSLTATDLTWQVQWSSDLFGWLTNNVTDIGISTNGGIEVRQGRVPASTSDPLFMRVRVTTP